MKSVTSEKWDSRGRPVPCVPAGEALVLCHVGSGPGSLAS